MAGVDTFTPREFIADLDSLPFPDWDEIRPELYQWAPHGGIVKAFPVAPVITTRGCPYDCHFCASPRIWHRRIRFRSPRNVVDEVELLVRKHGIREIHFEDDNISLREDHVLGICEELRQRRLEVHWALPNGLRADRTSEELFGIMRRSGCYSVAFGIESGVQSILNRIGKQTDLGQVEAAVNAAHRAGLITQGFFIFGLPGETEATIRQTLDFALRIPLDKAQFLLLDILPGTRLWDIHARDLSIDWTHQSFLEPLWIPEGLSRAKLLAAQGRAFRRFFLRPRQAFLVARHVRLKQLGFLFKRIRDFRMFRFQGKETPS
jgi:anaerobic magnesium-protoporphyrin IX monomethyl ester cyclase